MFDQFKSLITKGDQNCIAIKRFFQTRGIKINSKNKKGLSFSGLGWAITAREKSQDAFEATLNLCVEISVDQAIPKSLASGLYYLFLNSDVDFNDVRFRKKLKKPGLLKLATIFENRKLEHGKTNSFVFALGIQSAVADVVTITFTGTAPKETDKRGA